MVQFNLAHDPARDPNIGNGFHNGIRVFNESFNTRSAPGFHSLGHTFPSNNHVTALEALEEAGLDYRVGKFPINTYTKLNGPGSPPVKLPLPNHVVLLREPIPGDYQYRDFGVVSKDFHPIQNREIAATINEMTKTWPVETVGVNGHGEKVFWCLYTGEYSLAPRSPSIGGGAHDPMRGYVTIIDHKDGTGALQVLDTDVRFFCWNVLRHALKTASMNFKILHTSHGIQNLNLYVQIMNAVRHSKSQIREVYQHLAVTPIVARQLSEILTTAYPEPTPTRNEAELIKLLASPSHTNLTTDLREVAVEAKHVLEIRTESQRALQSGAKFCFDKFNDENPAFANTLWAGYQAVVETEDYRVGRGNTALAALIGERAQTKARAFTTCVQLAGGSKSLLTSSN